MNNKKNTVSSFTFLANHSSELFLFNPLCRIIKSQNPSIKLNLCIPLASKRNLHLNKQDFINFDKVINVPDINFTKNFIKLYFSFFKVLNIFKSIENNSNLIMYEPYSLLSIITLDYFNKKNNSIIFSTNFNQDILNSLKLDIINTFLFSLNLLCLFKKGVKYGYYKTTFYPILDVKIRCHYQVVIGNTDFLKSIKAKKYIRLNNHPAFNIQSYTNREGFIILILSMPIYNENKNYKTAIEDVIKYLKINKIKFKIKDHPLSPFSDKELKLFFSLEDENFIQKATDIESYILINTHLINAVIGPTSTVLKSCGFLNIPNFCITGMFEERIDYLDYTEKYFKNSNTYIVNNINNLNDKIKISINLKEISGENNYSFFMNL